MSDNLWRALSEFFDNEGGEGVYWGTRLKVAPVSGNPTGGTGTGSSYPSTISTGGNFDEEDDRYYDMVIYGNPNSSGPSPSTVAFVRTANGNWMRDTTDFHRTSGSGQTTSGGSGEDLSIAFIGVPVIIGPDGLPQVYPSDLADPNSCVEESFIDEDGTPVIVAEAIVLKVDAPSTDFRITWGKIVISELGQELAAATPPQSLRLKLGDTLMEIQGIQLVDSLGVQQVGSFSLLLGSGATRTVSVGTSGNDVLAATGGLDILMGGSGYDTATFANSGSGVKVNLATAAASGGDAAGDVLSSIEGLIGSRFDDVLAGNAEANRIEGGGGNDVLIATGGADTLDGGSGWDAVQYATAAGPLVVDLTDHSRNAGAAAGQVLWSIEEVTGGIGNDVIVGTCWDNRLIGGFGDDTFTGGWGADALVGGAGSDTVRYDDTPYGVMVNLAANQAGGAAAGDSFAEIENVVGSSASDHLIGDGAANRLEGRNGNDTLDGAAGDDVLISTGGADVMYGGAGNDVLEIGGGSAFMASGAGSDLFRILRGTGYANVHDFDIVADRIAIDRAIFADYAQLMAGASQQNGYTQLSSATGTTITLNAVALSALRADDFLFV